MLRHQITIESLKLDNVESVSELAVKPFQQIFVNQPESFFTLPVKGMSDHIIKKEDVVIGTFRIDSLFHLAFTFAQFDTLGIRHFYIDKAHQGQGLGTETCRKLPTYLRSIFPRARGIYIMINVNNAGAYKSFIRGGWFDTEEKYTLSPTGSKNILWMPFK